MRCRNLARDVSPVSESDGQSSILNLLPVVVDELIEGVHPANRPARLMAGNSFLLCPLDRTIGSGSGDFGRQEIVGSIQTIALVE